MPEARSFFRLGGCREHGSIIGFQKLKPMRDVARMVVEMRDRQTKLGAQDRGGQLRHQFLGRVRFASKSVLEIATQT